MSLSFYGGLNDTSPLATLDINSVSQYANTHNIRCTSYNDYTIFTMPWKLFHDMVLRHIQPYYRHIQPHYVEIKNSPYYSVTLAISNQNNPLQLTQKSCRNNISSDILQIPDETPVDIIFDYTGGNHSLLDPNAQLVEHFGTSNSTSTLNFIIFIIVVAVVVYLVNYFFKMTANKVSSPKTISLINTKTNGYSWY